MNDAETGYQRVTQLILEQLEAGVVPWRRPWTADGEAPRPLGHRRPYRGINRLITYVPDANSVAYIASWAKRLGQHQMWIVQAAPQAERASQWLRGESAANARVALHEAS